MEYILQTNGISKRYGFSYALNKVNMTIAKGDIYGFVGENGSGKTTIIRTITGLIFPTEGSFKLFGVDNTDKEILKVRKKVGAVVETPSIYLNMSAYDNLKMQCEILGIKESDNLIQETLDVVGLGDLYNDKKRASSFSLGMRQRLGIAIALLGDIEFLILDEPMNGLDPSGIVEIRELILKLNREKNITFLISSHILSELSLVANKYGIISKGKLIKEITAEELSNECRKSVIIETDDIEKAVDVLKTIEKPENVKIEGDNLVIYNYEDLNVLVANIINNNIHIKKINCLETSIEDYYLSLVGGKHHA